MAHLRTFCYRKPPERLLQISERVFVFSCCFAPTKGSELMASQLHKKFPNSSIMVHNFGDKNHLIRITDSLSDHGITVINYHYLHQKSPLLTTIHRFLSSSSSWLLGQRNVILIVHCQNSALTSLVFMLAAVLICKNQFCDERKALELICNEQAPRMVLQLLDLLPSELRHFLRRNLDMKWPPIYRPLTKGFALNNSNSTMKIEPSEMQVSFQKPAQSKIILAARRSQTSPKVPSVPLSRYRSATSSVLGITALLHDHAESSNIEESFFTPESSLSGSNPTVFSPQSPPLLRRLPPLASVVPPPPPPPLSNVTIVKNQSTPSFSSTVCQDSSSLIPAKKSNAQATPSPPPPPPPQRQDSSSIIPAKKSNAPATASPPPPPPPQRACSPSPPAKIHQVVPPPPLGSKGKFQLRTSMRTQALPKKTVPLKAYHWLKLSRAMQGSLWAEAQKPEEASKVFELDMTELQSLFSITTPNSDRGGKTNRRGSGGLKPDKVHLIEQRRAYNCEIMLTKVKVPLSEVMSSVLALDDAALDIDQVDNLIKFCPTKEEIDLLTNYKGDRENLGKCEQFFLELIKVPRVESKLRVFSFKIQFFSQVSDLRRNLKIVNSASEEVKNSIKLKRVMQTILSLGNALNHGTARGSAVGFRLDSLLKLGETRSRNNKLTLIHYLCKVLAEKLPEVIDFHQDLVSLEAATKIQLKYLAEEMQAIGKGLEKIAQELIASGKDGAVSQHFFKTLKEFYGSAEEEVRSLASVYSVVGRNADALSLYFGEDPSRCPFEQVVSTLLNFVRMFRRAHDENCKQLEFEKKKAQKESDNNQKYEN